MSKNCEWCGQEFSPIMRTQRYCAKSHYEAHHNLIRSARRRIRQAERNPNISPQYQSLIAQGVTRTFIGLPNPLSRAGEGRRYSPR